MRTLLLGIITTMLLLEGTHSQYTDKCSLLIYDTLTVAQLTYDVLVSLQLGALRDLAYNLKVRTTDITLIQFGLGNNITNLSFDVSATSLSEAQRIGNAVTALTRSDFIYLDEAYRKSIGRPLPGVAGEFRGIDAPKTPQPATPQPATPQPATPQPATPQPATPVPATPQPPTPPPATPPPATVASTTILLPPPSTLISTIIPSTSILTTLRPPTTTRNATVDPNSQTSTFSLTQSLPMGVLIGIIVGVAVAVLAIIAVTVYCCCRAKGDGANAPVRRSSSGQRPSGRLSNSGARPNSGENIKPPAPPVDRLRMSSSRRLSSSGSQKRGSSRSGEHR